MTLMEIIRQCGARIRDSNEYLWQCFGHDARVLDFADTDGTVYCSVVFDTVTYNVYEVSMNVPGYDQAFRWLDPAFRSHYIAECVKRHIDPDQAWDQVKYIDIDEQTALEYAKDIGETYYDNLPVPETQ